MPRAKHRANMCLTNQSLYLSLVTVCVFVCWREKQLRSWAVKKNLRTDQFIFRFVGLLLWQNAICKSCHHRAAKGLTESIWGWPSSEYKCHRYKSQLKTSRKAERSSTDFTDVCSQICWIHTGTIWRRTEILKRRYCVSHPTSTYTFVMQNELFGNMISVY